MSWNKHNKRCKLNKSILWIDRLVYDLAASLQRCFRIGLVSFAPLGRLSTLATRGVYAAHGVFPVCYFCTCALVVGSFCVGSLATFVVLR